jgi:peptidoglycan-N-acetylglucosamine deacetylase
VRLAAEHGHEIACHAYNHEQLDALSIEDEREAIGKGLRALEAAGVNVVGFGAPRNSISAGGRDTLIERGLEYDGSAAYDPMSSLLDAERISHSSGDGRQILVVPFIMPNDWDALRSMRISESQMERMWHERLDRVVSMREPVFVLDVHQWLASRDHEMEVLRRFIRHAKSRGDCRVTTLRAAAAHAADHLILVEKAARAPGSMAAEVDH